MLNIQENPNEAINSQTVPPNPSQVIQSPNNPNKKWILYLSLVILVVLVIAASLYWYFFYSKESKTTSKTPADLKEITDIPDRHPDILNDSLGIKNLEMKVFGASDSGALKTTIKLMVITKDEIDHSNLSSLPPDTGRVFFHKTPYPYNYWMKNELIPLDFIWILDNKIIGFSLNVLPPVDNNDNERIPIFTPTSAIDTAVEVNKGYVENNHLEIGDVVEFSIP